MNWLQKIENKEILHEIELSGWSKDQLKQDAVNIWQDNNHFFFSLGDWSKVDSDDIKNSIKHVYPKAEIDWDYEAGPENGDWKKIL